MSHNTFHVALSVKDLPTAIEQYRKILGMEPAKVKPDYAKFEIADPPVILSLNLGGEPGTVSHLGIRYPGTGEVATELVRTKAQGVAVREQPGTTCCYAKADKFWVHDADGLGWEMYTLLEDAEVHSIVSTPEQACCAQTTTSHIAAHSRAAADSCCAQTESLQADAHPVQIQARKSCGC
jgi:catechol 2,3-dioxygenase-like lactoylglutathione lyase family enzyme